MSSRLEHTLPSCVPHLSPRALSSTAIDERPAENCRRGFLGAPAAAWGRGSPHRGPCPPARAGCFLKRGGRWSRWGVAPKQWLERSAPSPGEAVCRGHVESAAFSPGAAAGAIGPCPPCVLLFTTAPACRTVRFAVPRGFFVFCCSRRCLCRCKHSGQRAPDPGLSPGPQGKQPCLVSSSPEQLGVTGTRREFYQRGREGSSRRGCRGGRASGRGCLYPHGCLQVTASG